MDVSLTKAVAAWSPLLVGPDARSGHDRDRHRRDLHQRAGDAAEQQARNLGLTAAADEDLAGAELPGEPGQDFRGMAMANHTLDLEPRRFELAHHRIEHLRVGTLELLLAAAVALLVLLRRVEGEGRPLDDIRGHDAGTCRPGLGHGETDRPLTALAAVDSDQHGIGHDNLLSDLRPPDQSVLVREELKCRPSSGAERGSTHPGPRDSAWQPQVTCCRRRSARDGRCGSCASRRDP